MREGEAGGGREGWPEMKNHGSFYLQLYAGQSERP